MNGRNDYEYRIKTLADLTALQNLRRELDAQKKAVDATSSAARILDQEMRKVNAALESQAAKALSAANGLNRLAERTAAAGGDASQWIAARDHSLTQGGLPRVGKVKGAAGAFGTAFAESGGGARGVMAGARAGAGMLGASAAMLSGIGTVLVGAAHATNEYASAEERLAKLDAALAQRGQLKKEYRKELQAMAADMQSTTSIAGGEWLKVMTKLTQFGAGPDTMRQNIEAVKNLAGLLGGDLTEAAMIVGKAMQGEFASLSRLGIEFDDNASKAEKLQHVYQELAIRGGGQLEAAANTIAGSFRKMKHGASDLAEVAGSVISTVFSPFVKAGPAMLGTALSSWAGGAQTFFEWIGLLSNKTKEFNNAAKETTVSLNEHGPSVAETAAEYERLGKAIGDAEGQMDKYLSHLRSEENRKKDVLTAEFKRDTAAIDAEVKAGRMLPAAAVVAKRQREEKYHTDVGEMEQATRANESRIIGDEIKSGENAVARQKATAEEASAEYTNAAKTEETRGKLRRILVRKEQGVESQIEQLGRFVNFGDKDRKKWVPWARAEVETMEKQRDEAKTALESFDQANPKISVERLDELKAKKDAAESAAKKLSVVVNDRNEKLSGRKREVDADAEAAAKVQNFERQTRRIQGAQDISTAFMEAQAAGQPIRNPALTGEPRNDTALSAALAAKDRRIKELEAQMDAMANQEGFNAGTLAKMEQHAKEIARQRQHLAAIDHRVNAIGGNVSDIDRGRRNR